MQGHGWLKIPLIIHNFIPENLPQSKLSSHTKIWKISAPSRLSHTLVGPVLGLQLEMVLWSRWLQLGNVGLERTKMVMISSFADFHLPSPLYPLARTEPEMVAARGFFPRLWSATLPHSLPLSTMARQSEMQLWFEMWSGKEMKRVPWFRRWLSVEVGLRIELVRLWLVNWGGNGKAARGSVWPCMVMVVV